MQEGLSLVELALHRRRRRLPSHKGGSIKFLLMQNDADGHSRLGCPYGCRDTVDN